MSTVTSKDIKCVALAFLLGDSNPAEEAVCSFGWGRTVQADG